MRTTWVVVADEAIVRVLSKPDGDGVLRPVHELADPAAHAEDAAFRHDAFGRRAGGTAARGGPAGRQAGARAGTATSSAGLSGQHVEAEAFTRRVSDWLQAAMNAHRFDELHIAAAPRFLGLLRKAMSTELARHVVQQIDKDWVQSDERELAERFFGRGATD